MRTRITCIIVTAATASLVLAHTTPRALAGAPPCSTFVDTIADSGPGSLRDAIACAPSGGTITFDTNGVFSVPQTIMLLTGELVVDNNLTILGPGANRLTINGNHISRVFHIGSGIAPAAIVPDAAALGVNVTIAGLTIANGSTASTSGGGIYNDHSMLTVSNCTVTGNLAGFGGGGIENDGQGSGATLTVVDSTISGNQSAGAGGGIRNDADNAQATVTIINSTFSGNFSSSDFGGGIFNRGVDSGSATLVIDNSTFSGNHAGLVGGIFNVNLSASATVNIGSTILNAGASGANISNSLGTVTSDGYNLSSDDGGGFLTATGDQTNTPPLLGPLQDNGGPTSTHAPLCGSPAIDAGTNFLGLATDQRGFARTVGGATDIGAVEFTGVTYTVSNTSDSGAGSLRQAILDANAHAGADTIVFAPGVTGTIALTSGELLITDCLFLDGPGPTKITVDAGDFTNRVFRVAPDITVTIAGLAINAGFVNDSSPGGANGGGILNDHSTLTVSNCTIRLGFATGAGGGIYNDGASSGSATLLVIDSTLSENDSFADGGGIENDGQSGMATLTVVNSTISRNQSDTAGGGIFNDGTSGSATLHIVNSTFSGNSADEGGGVHNNGRGSGSAVVTVRNSTFSGNSASLGSSIYNNSFDGGATLEIGSTILNASGSSTNIFNDSGTITSDGYNLSSDGGVTNFDIGTGSLNATGDQIDTPPLLGPLQFNGGPTQTHAPLCGSPAIDAGTNFTNSATDQRGSNRTVIVSGIVNGGDGTDIGAVELQVAPICNHPPVAVCTNITVSADANCMATVNVSDINNGSSDPDSGDSITLSFNSSSVVSSTTLSGTGAHSVTLYVTDTHGAQDSCAATVTVVDVTPPHITVCPGPQTNSANASCQANVPNFITGVTASDNCSAVTVSQSPAAGTPVGLGTTSVAIYAVDAAGNTNNTCTTSFTVKDTTPPTITCPSNQTVNATMPSGAVVNYPAAVASDNCGVISSLTYSQNSGTVFPIGTTTVTSRAIDNSSNTNTCTFTVKVKSASEQITDLVALVNSLKGVNGGVLTALDSYLNAAQSALSAHKTASACSNLKEFISLASAQSGKHLTVAQANLLIAQATRIRAVLACP